MKYSTSLAIGFVVSSVIMTPFCVAIYAVLYVLYKFILWQPIDGVPWFGVRAAIGFALFWATCFAFREAGE